MALYKKSIFIFRRDLRLYDNIGLHKALKESQAVIPLFIFDPAQVTTKNRYKSNRAMRFMLESIIDLEKQLKKRNAHLYVFYGNPTTVLQNLFTTIAIDAVFINYDYTPFSITRDAAIQKLCAKNHITYSATHDELINSPTAILKDNGKPYTMFTPYFKKTQQYEIAMPVNKKPLAHFYTKTIKQAAKKQVLFKKILPNKQDKPRLIGGRTTGKALLKNLSTLKKYVFEHDIPILDSTSHLSPHLKFGTISIREAIDQAHKTLGEKHPLIRQFFWRDFFTQIAYHFPYIFGEACKKNYAKLTWGKNPEAFKRWCNGTTGFPIVDAGMRELNATGYINNRMRMIVASFLTKDLHIDWRMGERYFATQLIDYDPSVNNGNWQWVASTGCDAQPYFRIFNPWQQQKKFDKDCCYIKQWVPELKNIPVKIIHAWHKNHGQQETDYPEPMLDHAQERRISITAFKNRY